MFKKILVPYDLSEKSRNALDWAVKIASKEKAEIIIQHVMIQDPRLISYNLVHYKDEIEKNAKTAIAEDLKKLSAPALSVSTLVTWGDPVSTIAQTIKSKNIDLVITGTHGRTGIKHFFLGSTAEKITRLSPAPVLTVRGKPESEITKVLVPVDFAEYTEELLLVANHLHQLGSHTFELFHVITPPDVFFYTPNELPFNTSAWNDEFQKNSEKKLKEIALKHPSLNATCSVDFGPVANTICEKAKKIKADLILIPTHGRKGLNHFLLGSVAEQVVRYSPCSVLSFSPTPEKQARMNG